MNNVLIAGDNHTSLKTLTEILSRFGCNTFSAENGEAALALIRHGISVDLILIDLDRTVTAGLEFLYQMRNEDPRIPCVMVTEHYSLGNYLKAVNPGVYAYFYKPAESKIIGQFIASALIRGLRQREKPGKSSTDMFLDDAHYHLRTKAS